MSEVGVRDLAAVPSVSGATRASQPVLAGPPPATSATANLRLDSQLVMYTYVLIRAGGRIQQLFSATPRGRKWVLDSGREAGVTWQQIGMIESGTVADLSR